MLDNYLLQLHVGGKTDHTENTIFNNIVETDLHRRFNTVVFDFMANINATIERLLAQSPLSLIFTENESRIGTLRCLSYRRALSRIMMSVTNSTSSLYTSNFSSVEESTWRMLFHNREESTGEGMSTAMADAPPSGISLLQLLNQYRTKNFTSTRGKYVQGGEWSNVEPTKLMEIIMFAFIEHDIIPPLSTDYSTSLANFFSILMSDPIQQIFTRHIKMLYRRGWRKDSLARKACFTIAEQYVGLVMLVLQQALMQTDCTLSTTPSFTGNVQQFLPLTKIQDVLRSLLLAFDPVSYIPEEIVNRTTHEEKFKHHFKQYSRYVSEIIESYELWLQDEVDGYRTGINIRRDNLFLNIISSGGYEESRSNYLNNVTMVAAETDEATQNIQTSNQSTQYDDMTGEDLKKIEIKVKNAGTVPLSGPADLNRNPIVVIDDPDNETTQVVVDASHPSANGLTHRQMMEAISAAVKSELKMIIKKVVVPTRNQNSSSSTKSYLAYASTVDYSGDAAAAAAAADEREELLESVLENEISIQGLDVQPSDSASQVNDFFNVDDDTVELETVDFNAPNQLIMSSSSSSSSNGRMREGYTNVNINEPKIITADNTDVNAVLNDGSVGDLTVEEIDVTDSKLIPDELKERLYHVFGTEDGSVSSSNVLMNEVPSESAVPQQTLSTHQKNKYSASNDIRRSNFENITYRIAKVSNKADKELAELRSKLRKQRDEKSTLNRHIENSIKRGLIKSEELADREFEVKKTHKLEKLRALAIPSVKAMEVKNKDNLKRRLIPQYHQHQKMNKVKKTIKVSKKLSRKRSTLVESPDSAGQTPRKKAKKQDLYEQEGDIQRMRDIDEQLNQLENIQRNIPQRLVTKPLPEDSPFRTGSTIIPSVYVTSDPSTTNSSTTSSMRRKEKKKKKKK
jgi:hypothetical protein